MKGFYLMLVVACVFTVHELGYQEGIKKGIAKPYEISHSCNADRQLVKAYKKSCLIKGE